MDKELFAALKPSPASGETIGLKLVDLAKGEVELKAAGRVVRWVVKPLAQLYGEGAADSSPSTDDDYYLPLLFAIEEQIVDDYKANPDVTDGLVELALDKLIMAPEAEPRGDLLAQHIQVRLRALLSLNDYSRREVVWALRKVWKSVRLHTSMQGIRGYLDFISTQPSFSR